MPSSLNSCFRPGTSFVAWESDLRLTRMCRCCRQIGMPALLSTLAHSGLLLARVHSCIRAPSAPPRAGSKRG
eukprot:1843371-Alexandrium_andersonii.AAC.1